MTSLGSRIGSPLSGMRRIGSKLMSPGGTTRLRDVDDRPSARLVRGDAFVRWLERRVGDQGNPVFLETCTTAELVVNFILPLTTSSNVTKKNGGFGTSLFELLPQNDVGFVVPLDELSDESATYLCHTWGRPVRELLSMMSSSDGLFFIDIVAVNQSRALVVTDEFALDDADGFDTDLAVQALCAAMRTSNSTNGSPKPRVLMNPKHVLDLSHMREIINECSVFVLLLSDNSTSDVLTTSRTWCLFELLVALDASENDELKKVEIEFPFDYKVYGEETLEESASRLAKRLACLQHLRIAVGTSATSIPSDRMRLLEWIRTSYGTLDKGDQVVKTWVLQHVAAVKTELAFFRECSSGGGV